MGVETVASGERHGLFVSAGTGGPGGGPGSDPDEEGERDLGVIEAITMVTRSCPSGVVVGVAERALEAIKEGGAGVMREQAYYVLTALQGWRGDRARQVHRSLTRYLEQDTPERGRPEDGRPKDEAGSGGRD